jgi:geranylgeranyl diphosphate synthase type I
MADKDKQANNPLEKVKREILRKGEIVNRAIDEMFPVKEPKGLYMAARHLIDAGGKRLRPVMCLLAAEAIGMNADEALKAAVAVEIIHNFTLIHDDIMDRDEMRRGVKTVHTLYGESTAILAGDTLFAKAFSILADDHHSAGNVVKACRMLADVCVEICEGQYIDLSFESRDIRDVSIDEYLEMIRKKTAVLIACSCSIPAVLAGKDEYAKALWKFGEMCGIGFQIHDDVLDLVGGEKIGKDWGSDLIEGKKTLIIIKAAETGVDIPVFGRGNASREEIEKAVRVLEECGAIDYAKREARNFVSIGKKELRKLPETKARATLETIADYLVSREY